MIRFAMKNPMELAERITAAASDRSERWQAGARQAGIEGQQRAIMSRSPEDAADYIVHRTPGYVDRIQAADPRNEQAVRDHLKERVQGMLDPQGQAGSSALARRREDIAADYSQEMNRGLTGGERGPVEGVLRGLNNPMVRNGGLGAAGLGAAVGTGALLTEGAQQLMTLMDFLQAGEDTRERADQSPLV